MKREDIEKAAEDFVMQNSPSYTECFLEGANWRISSVWHDASERPKDRNAQCLVEVESGGSSFFLLSQFYHSGGFSFMDGIRNMQPKRWAYTKDLITNTEE